MHSIHGHRFPRSLMRDDPTPPREAACPSCRSVGQANEWGDRRDEPAGRSSRSGIQLSQFFGYPKGRGMERILSTRPCNALRSLPSEASENSLRLFTVESLCRPATRLLGPQTSAPVLPTLGTRNDARCSDPEHAESLTSASGRTSPTGQIDQSIALAGTSTGLFR
jgi:hypothetical protein